MGEGGMAGWVTRGREGGLTHYQVEGGGGLELHQIFLDMAVLVEAQVGGKGERSPMEGGESIPGAGRGGDMSTSNQHGLNPSHLSAGGDAGQYPEAGGAQRGLRQGRHGGAGGREEAAEEHEKGACEQHRQHVSCLDVDRPAWLRERSKCTAGLPLHAYPVGLQVTPATSRHPGPSRLLRPSPAFPALAVVHLMRLHHPALVLHPSPRRSPCLP